MILIKVVDQVPEQLLVSLLRSELTQVNLEVPILVQSFTYLLIKSGSTFKFCLKFFVALVVLEIGSASSSSVHLLANRHLETGLGDDLTTECAKYNDIIIAIFGRLSNSFPQLRCKQLSLTHTALLFQLEAHLLTVYLIAADAGGFICR